MVLYCKNCGKYLGEVDFKKNIMKFTTTKRIELVKNKLLVTCKCKHITSTEIES